MKAPDDEVAPTTAPSGADAIRENLKKTEGAEMNPRATTDKLKTMGDAMANKHGG